MIAVDTNILVYAHREDSVFFQPAAQQLAQLAESSRPWAIPWPCLHEFLAVVTHPRLYRPPTPLPQALEQIQCWLEAPRLQLLYEEEGYWEILEEICSQSKISGPAIHDARIAALCQLHQVEALWTADRDFSRFKGLKVLNPLSL